MLLWEKRHGSYLAGLEGAGDTQLEKLTAVEELEDITALGGRARLFNAGANGSMDPDDSRGWYSTLTWHLRVSKALSQTFRTFFLIVTE